MTCIVLGVGGTASEHTDSKPCHHGAYTLMGTGGILKTKTEKYSMSEGNNCFGGKSSKMETEC